MQGKVRQLGIEIGVLPVGQKNCITDVEGVQVGHVTLDEPLDQNGGPMRVQALQPFYRMEAMYFSTR